MPKKLEDYPWFCPEPFTNFMNSVGGMTKPCCHINTKNWRNQDIKSFRKEFINGGGPLIDKCCTRCIKQEEFGNKSFRQSYLEYFSGKFAHKKKQLEDNLDNPPLLTIEFKAQDNLCNLRCNICKPILSSSLAKENFVLGKSPFLGKLLHPKMNNNGPHFKSKSTFPDLENILEFLKMIFLN